MIILIGLFALGMVTLFASPDTSTKQDEPVPLVAEVENSDRTVLPAPIK
jgi:hypothetical protein